MTGAGSITDVPGIRVGQAQRVGDGWLTGTTVVLPPREGAVAGGDVRVDEFGWARVKREGRHMLQRPAHAGGGVLERRGVRGDAELVGREVMGEGGTHAEPEGIARGEHDGGGAAEGGDLRDHVDELEGRPGLELGAAPTTGFAGPPPPLHGGGCKPRDRAFGADHDFAGWDVRQVAFAEADDVEPGGHAASFATALRAAEAMALPPRRPRSVR